MPTYQYSCTECGHFFEQVQSFSDDALTSCPACQGRLRKVFNAVGVVFKGSGFYRTDSRADATSKAKSKDKAAAAPTASTPGSTDSSGSTGSSKGATKAPASTATGSSSSTSAA